MDFEKQPDKSRTGNETALITGATSGIGKAFAEEFARRGYNLIITGRRTSVIEGVAHDLKMKYGISVKVVIAELNEDEGIQKVIKEIQSNDSLQVLVNNAGFGQDKIFIKESIQNHLGMVHVHIIAALQFIHTALPGMIAQGKGIIINVSSAGAYTPSPINSIYGSTKAFLNIFSESIHVELRKKGIKVQALCPGFTATDFHKKIGMENELHDDKSITWMSPEDVVSQSMRALSKGRVICIPGFKKRFVLRLIQSIPKSLYYNIVEKKFQKYLTN